MIAILKGYFKICDINNFVFKNTEYRWRYNKCGIFIYGKNKDKMKYILFIPFTQYKNFEITYKIREGSKTGSSMN